MRIAGAAVCPARWLDGVGGSLLALRARHIRHKRSGLALGDLPSASCSASTVLWMAHHGMLFPFSVQQAERGEKRRRQPGGAPGGRGHE